MENQILDDKAQARARRRAVKRLSGRQARLTLYYILTQFAVLFLISLVFGLDTEQAQLQTFLPSALIGLLIAVAMRGFRQINRDLSWRGRAMSGGALLRYAALLIGAQGLLQLWLIVAELILNQFGLSVLEGVTRMNESMAGADSIQMFAYVALVGPVVEELVFRGAVLHTLRERGDWFALVVSSVLFALMHGNLPQALFALPVGLLLGYVALNHSVQWAIALHVFNNLVLGEGLAWIERQMGGVGTLLAVVLIYGALFASLAIVAQKWRAIGGYMRRHAAGPHEMRWALSSAWVWVLGAITLWITISLVSVFGTL